MLFLYEMMCWIQFEGKSAVIRNGADVFLRQLIMGFGNHSESIYGLLLIIVFFGIMFFNRNVVKNERLKSTFLLFSPSLTDRPDLVGMRNTLLSRAALTPRNRGRGTVTGKTGCCR